METGENNGWNSKPWRVAAWAIAGVILLIPVSIQLIYGNFGWSPADFVFVAAILFVSCFIFDLSARYSANFSYLAGVAGGLAASFGLFVVNGAVGLVGSEDESHNLLFLFVPLIAMVGAIISRGRALGMSCVMFAAAIAHIMISVGLLIQAGGKSDGDRNMEIIGLIVFAVVWVASAWFFYRSTSGKFAK